VRCSAFLLASLCATAGPAAWATEPPKPPPCKPAETVEQSTTNLARTTTAGTAYNDYPSTAPCFDPQTVSRVVGVQSSVTIAATLGLTGTIMGRLDSVRGEGAAVSTTTTTLAALGSNDGMMALGAKDRSRGPAASGPAGPASPFTAYVMGTFLGGNSADTPGLAGFDYGTTAGVVGLELSVNRNLILGLAGGLANSRADLTTGDTIGADSVQVAAYLSYATKAWFVDALAAYGAVDLDMARMDYQVHSSTNAAVLALATRGGYLFDFGKVRAGPIAGLSYVYGRYDAYTETGPADLISTVGTQTVETIVGSAGVRFLAPFQASGHLFVPYLNVTLEHQFGSATQTLNLTQAGVPFPVSFPVFDARDYGKVEGGITIELAPEAAISISGASTFAREDGNDFRISTGLNYRF
jgi:uncharacterized protein YhjY with autotransporter beta-barrel domain